MNVPTMVTTSSTAAGTSTEWRSAKEVLASAPAPGTRGPSSLPRCTARAIASTTWSMPRSIESSDRSASVGSTFRTWLVSIPRDEDDRRPAVGGFPLGQCVELGLRPFAGEKLGPEDHHAVAAPGRSLAEAFVADGDVETKLVQALGELLSGVVAGFAEVGDEDVVAAFGGGRVQTAAGRPHDPAVLGQFDRRIGEREPLVDRLAELLPAYLL